MTIEALERIEYILASKIDPVHYKSCASDIRECISEARKAIKVHKEGHPDTHRLRVMTEAWEKAEQVAQASNDFHQAIKDGYMIVVPTAHYNLLLDTAKTKVRGEQEELAYLKKYNSDGSLRIPQDKGINDET